MKIVTSIEQTSEQWFRLRAGRPTASQFSRILTPTGKDSGSWHDYAVELCAESLLPDELSWPGNRHTDRGNELEPEAREHFALTMGLGVQEVAFITRDDEIVGCSPDALVYQEDNEEPIAGLEIKCPLAKNHAKTVISQTLPDEYKPQVHGGLAVTGLDFWYFVSYCPSSNPDYPGLKPVILRIERDDYTEQLSDALDRFLMYYQELRKEVMPKLTP